MPSSKRGGEAPLVLGGFPLGKSRTVRQGKGHSQGPATLREELGVPLDAAQWVGFAWIEKGAFLGGRVKERIIGYLP